MKYKYCPHCGHKIIPGTTFCGHCGYRFTSHLNNNIQLSGHILKPLFGKTQLLILPAYMLIVYIGEFISIIKYSVGDTVNSAVHPQAGAIADFTFSDRAWIVFCTIVFIIGLMMTLQRHIWTQAIGAFIGLASISSLLSTNDWVEDTNTYTAYILFFVLIALSRLNPEEILNQRSSKIYLHTKIWIARVVITVATILLVISIKYIFLMIIPILITAGCVMGLLVMTGIIPQIRYYWSDSLDGYIEVIFSPLFGPGRYWSRKTRYRNKL